MAYLYQQPFLLAFYQILFFVHPCNLRTQHILCHHIRRPQLENCILSYSLSLIRNSYFPFAYTSANFQQSYDNALRRYGQRMVYCPDWG